MFVVFEQKCTVPMYGLMVSTLSNGVRPYLKGLNKRRYINQYMQDSRFGSRESEVRILSPRPFKSLFLSGLCCLILARLSAFRFLSTFLSAEIFQNTRRGHRILQMNAARFCVVIQHMGASPSAGPPGSG